MNDFDAAAMLRSLASGDAELASVVEAEIDGRVEDAFLALQLDPVARLLSRTQVADHGWVPLMLGAVTGRKLFQSVVVALNPEPALDLGQPGDPGEPAETRALREKAKALGEQLIQTAERMRDIVRDALAGKDVLEKLAYVRRRDRWRRGRLALLELCRLQDTVVLNGEFSVGGLYSAPKSVSFTQKLHCAHVLHANGPNRFVVIGAWTSTKTKRVERNFNSGFSGKILVEVPNERLVDELIYAWRTRQTVSLMIKCSWALGTGADRFELKGAGMPKGMREDVDRLADDVCSGRRRATGDFSPRTQGAQLSWDFDNARADDLAE